MYIYISKIENVKIPQTHAFLIRTFAPYNCSKYVTLLRNWVFWNINKKEMSILPNYILYKRFKRFDVHNAYYILLKYSKVTVMWSIQATWPTLCLPLRTIQNMNTLLLNKHILTCNLLLKSLFENNKRSCRIKDNFSKLM